jgi:hypothetical protein
LSYGRTLLSQRAQPTS